jgi:hypothetical protein
MNSQSGDELLRLLGEMQQSQAQAAHAASEYAVHEEGTPLGAASGGVAALESMVQVEVLGVADEGVDSGSDRNAHEWRVRISICYWCIDKRQMHW